MLIKSKDTIKIQSDLFKPLLCDIASPIHHYVMVKFANAIGWQNFEDGLSASFCVDTAIPSVRFV